MAGKLGKLSQIRNIRKVIPKIGKIIRKIWKVIRKIGKFIRKIRKAAGDKNSHLFLAISRKLAALSLHSTN